MRTQPRPLDAAALAQISPEGGRAAPSRRPALKMLCTRCGTVNAPYAQFCAVCGQAPAARAGEYYVHHAASNQVYGPLSEAAVREWVAQRRISGGDNLRAVGSEAWVPLTRTPFGQQPAAAFVAPPALAPPPARSPLKDEGSSLILTGVGLICVGIVLSATGIGACLGVPLKIAGICVVISGIVKQRRPPASLPSPPPYAPAAALPQAGAPSRCASCGSLNATGAAFCASCGAPQR